MNMRDEIAKLPAIIRYADESGAWHGTLCLAVLDYANKAPTPTSGNTDTGADSLSQGDGAHVSATDNPPVRGEALPSPVPVAWQTIETAPDYIGPHSIRLLGIMADGYHVFCTYTPYYADKEPERVWHCNGFSAGVHPTHWMPLPSLYAHPPTSEWNDAIETVAEWYDNDDPRLANIRALKREPPR